MNEEPVTYLYNPNKYYKIGYDHRMKGLAAASDYYFRFLRHDDGSVLTTSEYEDYGDGWKDAALEIRTRNQSICLSEDWKHKI